MFSFFKKILKIILLLLFSTLSYCLGLTLHWGELNFAALSNDSFTFKVQQNNPVFAAFMPRDH